jgi:transposase
MENTATKNDKGAFTAERPYDRAASRTIGACRIAALHAEIEKLKERERCVGLERIEWRLQANYRKALHERAVEREALLKERVKELEAQVQALTEALKGHEDLKAKYAQLVHLHFGCKTEHQDPKETQDDDAAPADRGGKRSPRKRGQQPGQKGHGRTIRKKLPQEVILHELPAKERCCPNCRLPYEEFPGTEDSEEIQWEIHVTRRVHKRKRYKPTCQCDVVPGIVTAPPVPKLIPKGLFSVGFWVLLILEKFLLQRPLNRVRRLLDLHGLQVSLGTLTGGLKCIDQLVQPLYTKILEKSRNAHHWHMDETRWLVFEELEGKEGHRWWLWVVATQQTCCFILDPSRSSSVPTSHLREAEGILNVDRYSAYKAFAAVMGTKIKLAFCWAHVRRDFLGVGEGYKKLHEWSQEWVERINTLFHLNGKRREVVGEKARFAYRQRKLRNAIGQMASQFRKELARHDLHSAQKKVLASLRNHWAGLTLFVEDPAIPMDNNEAERDLRNAVLGRKSFYGSGAVWSGQLTAALYTILETVARNGINPHQFLRVYFEACAKNGGKPPADIDAFLPWSFSPEVRSALEAPEAPS